MTGTEYETGPTDDDAQTVVDVKLFKMIGLYQLLWPGARRYREIFMVIVWLTFGLQCVQTVRLYLAMGDTRLATYLAVLIVNGLMSLYKVHVITINADRLRTVLDVARYEFLSCHRDWSAMSQCRTTVFALLRPFCALSFSTLILWIVHSTRQTWLAHDDSFAVVALIGIVETIVFIVNITGSMMFYCFTVTVCFTLKNHFENVFAAYETLGRRRTPSLPSNTAGHNVVGGDSDNLSDYDKLNSYIMDNQKIIKKFDDFFDIVRSVILLQIATSSFALITLIFLSAMEFLMNWSITSVTFFQYFTGCILIGIEFYIYCYTFNHFEITKSNMNFGLYSSDWTTMDLKCKKKLLLAMNMNSSHVRLMKLTQSSVLNLEMFVSVLKMSYTIVSLILKMSVE